MQIVKTIKTVRDCIALARRAGKPIAFVPTMGALHHGHQEIIRRAQAGAENTFVVVSIFVNPTQFGPGEDYRAYPRDLDHDRDLAAAAGADLIFAPEVEEIYPAGDTTFVEEGRLSEGLCGPFRPGHFRGVATVVCKLLNIVQPDRAYFGEKDYQQLKIIQRMVQDLHLPLTIVSVPTVREADGLAMSSRNAYLSPAERQAALSLSAGLRAARQLAADGERAAEKLIAAVRQSVAEEPLARLEYVEMRDAETLESVSLLEKPAVLALAARVGRARLIDNVILQADN
jgi:pantoate--beta-alanine ligase